MGKRPPRSRRPSLSHPRPGWEGPQCSHQLDGVGPGGPASNTASPPIRPREPVRTISALPHGPPSHSSSSLAGQPGASLPGPQQPAHGWPAPRRVRKRLLSRTAGAAGSGSAQQHPSKAPAPGGKQGSSTTSPCAWPLAWQVGAPRGLWALGCFCGHWSHLKAFGVLGALEQARCVGSACGLGAAEAEVVVRSPLH